MIRSMNFPPNCHRGFWRSIVCHSALVIVTGALAILVPGAGARADEPQMSTAIPVTQIRAWGDWYKMRGEKPNFKALAKELGDVKGIADDSDRKAKQDALAKIMSDAYDAADPTQSFKVLIEDAASPYDAKSGGFYIPLLDGAKTIPLSGDSLTGNPNAQDKLPESIEIRFTNSADAQFYKCTEAQYKEGVTSDKTRAVSIKLELQPVGANVLCVDGQEPHRYLDCHILKVVVSGRASDFFLTRWPAGKAKFAVETFDPVPATQIGALTASGAAPLARSNEPSLVAQLWSKLTGVKDADVAFDKAVQSNPDYTQANEFQQPKILAQRVAVMKAEYDALTPQTDFRVGIGAKLGAYDGAHSGFDMGIDNNTLIPNPSPFPYTNADLSPFPYVIMFTNPDQARYIPYDPDDAEALLTATNNARDVSMELTLTPEAAVAPDPDHNGQRVLKCRIKMMRVFGPKPDVLLYQATFPAAGGK
jgi:hypothetical protein